MSVPAATAVVALVGAYLLLGLVFAVWFVVAGCGRIDPVAKAGTRGFRLLILPGAAALWPLLGTRLLAGADRPPEESNAHRDATKGAR